MKLIVHDRYSNKVFSCDRNTLFIVGSNIWTIRKNNPMCVDNISSGAWFCLEYVLKNPTVFVPLVICKDIGTKTYIPKKTMNKPFIGIPKLK